MKLTWGEIQAALKDAFIQGWRAKEGFNSVAEKDRDAAAEHWAESKFASMLEDKDVL